MERRGWLLPRSDRAGTGWNSPWRCRGERTDTQDLYPQLLGWARPYAPGDPGNPTLRGPILPPAGDSPGPFGSLVLKASLARWVRGSWEGHPGPCLVEWGFEPLLGASNFLRLQPATGARCRQSWGCGSDFSRWLCSGVPGPLPRCPKPRSLLTLSCTRVSRTGAGAPLSTQPRAPGPG